MADSDKQTIIERGSGSDNSMPLVFSVIAILLAVIAVILGAVSLSQKGTNNFNIAAPAGGGGGGIQSEERIWMLQIGHTGARTEYLDEVSGQIKGFTVDIVNAVCTIANKNCRLVADIYPNCWDSEVGESQRGGKGIFDQYYDACISWLPSYIRIRTFQFTKAFIKNGVAGFAVKSGNPNGFDWRDLTGKMIGFIDGWINDEACLIRHSDTITGADLPPEQVVHYIGRDELLAGLMAGEVDAVVDFKDAYKNNDVVDFVSDDIGCALDGPGMMLRKDNRLAEWFDPALERLLSTTEYKTICNDLLEVHGHISGYDPEDACIGF